MIGPRLQEGQETVIQEVWRLKKVVGGGNTHNIYLNIYFAEIFVLLWFHVPSKKKLECVSFKANITQQ